MRLTPQKSGEKIRDERSVPDGKWVGSRVESAIDKTKFSDLIRVSIPRLELEQRATQFWY